MAGVGLASLKELSFTWLSFTAGTISAVTSATKAILSKKVLDGKPMGENLTPANMFAVLTVSIRSFFYCHYFLSIMRKNLHSIAPLHI